MAHHRVEVDAPEAPVDLRQALLVRALPRLEDVVERAEALLPVLEIAAEIPEVAIVLERLLEFVARHELVEVSALDRVRHLVQAPIPSGGVAGRIGTLAEQLRDQ